MTTSHDQGKCKNRGKLLRKESQKVNGELEAQYWESGLFSLEIKLYGRILYLILILSLILYERVDWFTGINYMSTSVSGGH